MSTVTALHGKHFLKLSDFTPEELIDPLDHSAELKAAIREARDEHRPWAERGRDLIGGTKWQHP